MPFKDWYTKEFFCLENLSPEDLTCVSGINYYRYYLFDVISQNRTIRGCAGDQPASLEPSFRLDKRQLWTTSRIQGSPDPAKPYITRRAFPHLKFEEPLDMQSDPISDRFYVVERYGKIYSFANNLNVDQTDLLLDLGKVIYGLALDPQFHRDPGCNTRTVISPIGLLTQL